MIQTKDLPKHVQAPMQPMYPLRMNQQHTRLFAPHIWDTGGTCVWIWALGNTPASPRLDTNSAIRNMSSLNKDAFWAVHTVHFAVGAQRLFSGTARENTSVLFRIWGGGGQLMAARQSLWDILLLQQH